MRRYTLMTLGTLAVLAMFTMLSGCATQERQQPTLQQQSAPQQAAEAKPAEDKPKTASADDLKKKRKELRDKERQIARLERDLNVAQQKLEKARLSMEHTGLRNEASLIRAEAELDLAMRRLAIFNEQNVPSRLAWGELSLQNAQDRFQEAQEELDQLELMYNEDEFADQTKEIVLERGRRRLQRSQRDLELRRVDFATLQQQNLPVERREQELQVTDKEEGLKRAHEAVATSVIDQEIGLISAEGEIIRLENELDDTREEIEELKEEVAKMEKEVAEAAKEPKE
jgi:hypothetical protein